MPYHPDLREKHGWKLNGQFESISAHMTWKVFDDLSFFIFTDLTTQG